jgi:hypothetical protein
VHKFSTDRLELPGLCGEKCHICTFGVKHDQKNRDSVRKGFKNANASVERSSFLLGTAQNIQSSTGAGIQVSRDILIL